MNRHPLAEDLFALFSASALISLAVFFLKSAGLLSGGTAGLALVLNLVTELTFGQLFFLVNLPFYYLGWRCLGNRFTINTLIAVTVISLGADSLGHVLIIESVGTVYAAAIAGVLAGVGMLILFRHNASLGGVGILAVYLQQRFNIPAGRTLLLSDISILVIAVILLPPVQVLVSAVSVVLVSAVLVLNHKPYRYQLR